MKARGRFLKSHTRGNHVIVVRISASKTIAFAIKMDCIAFQVFVLAKTVSTMKELQRYHQLLMVTKNLELLRVESEIRHLKNEHVSKFGRI